MNQSAISRQVQLAQQQARMAAGSQQGQASVGACAPQNSPYPPSAGYGTGQYGAQYGPNANFDPSLPQNAPWVHPAALVNPYQVIQSNYVPLGVDMSVTADGAAVTGSFFPTHGLYYIAGIRVCNECDEIEIVRITTGGSDLARNAGAFDAAAYNTIECFCPVDWGCISQQNPLNLTARAKGTPSVAPTLTAILFGTHQQGFNTCYPGLPAAIGLQPGVYGQPAAGALPG
jgi:hypothetical protein